VLPSVAADRACLSVSPAGPRVNSRFAASQIIDLGQDLSECGALAWPWSALKKEVRYAFSQRPEMPPGTPEWKITWRLFKIIWKIHWETRSEWLTMVTRAAESGKPVHHFHNPRETRQFLESVASR
jgi:hypothetical protein